MKKKKIIIYTPNLNIGGIARVLLAYAKGLGEKGYEVIYLICTPKGDFTTETFVNVRFINLGTLRLRKSLFALTRFFKKNKPDIIITANEITFIVLLAKWFSCCSAKLITSHHNYSDCDILINNMIVRYIYPFCDSIIAVSQGISSMLINQFNLKANKVVAIYNPVDTELILQSANVEICDIPNEYILFVGRLNAVKNLPLLFRAYKIFYQCHPNVELVIIGDDDDRMNGQIKDDLKTLAYDLKLDSVIHLIGVKSNPFPYIRCAKIVVLSSLSEALPTILIESLILGKTVVSTPTQGAIDILKNGTYGYLSDSLTDINSFADKLKFAYDRPIDEYILTETAKQNYDLNTKIPEIENLWKS